MKLHPIQSVRPRRTQGFTLIELLIVMAIIAVLASLTIGAFNYANQASARHRTTATLAALQSALEVYKERDGEYPSPANKNAVQSFGGYSVRYGGAMMLYQVLTADGDNAIYSASGSQFGASNGITTTEEGARTINNNLPKGTVLKTAAGYMIADGFSRPFQYDRAGDATTVNPTYDLWSYGTLPAGGLGSTGVSSGYSENDKRDPIATGPWIKNW